MSVAAGARGGGAHTFGVVVLTMGTRPDQLARGLTSLMDQDGVSLDIVVVGNGWEPVGLPKGVRGLYLPENVGIPAGRNAGVPAVSGEFLFFLDDDSWLLDRAFLMACAGRLRADPGLGMIQPQIIDPDRPGEEPARWIPRIRKGDPGASSVVFAVGETALALPRAVYDATGGWPSQFYYAHEGIELAWRVWDTGRRVEYHGDLKVGHPVVEPTRHEEYLRLNARNRVWLARRCLSWPLSWAYVANWTLVQVVRTRELSSLRTWFAGWLSGWQELPWPPGERPARLTWRTVARMTVRGRPPLI